MDRRSALVTHERKAIGGSYFDSLTHAAMFRAYKPHDFGVMSARLFSAEVGSDLINKKFTYYTIAQKNVYVLPGGVDDYTWYVMGDTDVEFRFTELLVDPLGYAGKGGLPFQIALDRDWLHEPAMIKVANSNLPFLRIMGQPVQRSANSWAYEVEVQDGDPNSYIPVAYLQPGMTAIRTSSFVSDEGNTKYAPDQYGEMYKLQNHVANYANKAEFTDKFIRTEIACKNSGRSLGNDSYTVGGTSHKGAAISSGYMYQADLKDAKTSKVIKMGTFITNVEARLEDRTQLDREYAMEWGRLQITKDRDSGRTMKMPAGWRQLVKDGHYLQHNGNLSLSDIFEFLNNLFLTRKNFKDRKIKLAGGEGAIDFLSRLIFQEYSSIVTVDTLFAQKRTDGGIGVHENELVYGSQFTKIRMTNGIEVEIMHDPNKDNRQLFPELAPGTNRTLESFCMDIFDLGVTDQTPVSAGSKNNLCMIMQDGVEEFYTVSNVYNFETGAERSGGNVYGTNKDLGIFRAMSGSLNSWDASRLARIEFIPNV